MNQRPPLLVFAVGNASRGDDALGPALAACLQDHAAFADGRAELIEAYQLQIEDVLQIAGRAAVLFIDAAREAVPAGLQLRALEPRAGASAFTHALAPNALLALAPRVLQATPPPAWLLAIQGEAFELGAALSGPAATRLPRAEALARRWLEETSPGMPAAIDRASPAVQ